MHKIIFILVLYLCILNCQTAPAETRCIVTEGEAAIAGHDIHSAKIEALARAKWAAIEKVAGVQIRSETVVQNMRFIDEAVCKEIRGVITGHKVLIEEIRKESVYVKTHVCVESLSAKDALSTIIPDSSVSVLIYTPVVNNKRGYYEENSISAEVITDRLIEQGFTVKDILSQFRQNRTEFERALRSDNGIGLRAILYNSLSNIIVIGKADHSIIAEKGDDVGYGLTTPFYHARTSLEYRIAARSEKNGINILASGVEQGKGFGLNVKDAVSEGMKDVAEKAVQKFGERINDHMKGTARRIFIKIDGVENIGTNFEIKSILQDIAWVTKVEEKGMGGFIVYYSEKPVYLANSISQKEGFKIIDFTVSSIMAVYKKQ